MLKLRRGLPRVAGGDPWPPADATAPEQVATDAAVSDAAVASADTVTGAAVAEAATVPAAASAAPDAPSVDAEPSAPVASSAPAATPAPVPTASVSAASAASGALRRGLPRVAGGDPWPPAGAPTVPVAPAAQASALDAVAGAAASTPASAATAAVAATPAGAQTASAPAAAETPAATSAPVAAPAAATAATAADGQTVRRGLPRTPGAEPWPPAGTVAAASVVEAVVSDGAAEAAAAPAVSVEVAAASAAVVPAGVDVSTPLPFTRTVWPGQAPRHGVPRDPNAPKRPTWTQVIAGLFGVAALGVAAAAAVFFVRALLGTPALQDFLAAFPGEYHLPENAPVGIPAWLGWQHFLNAFFMLLIIRTGWQVRTDKRPTAFWTSRRKSKSKMSLTLWLHQAIDLLWLINGLVFFVLLFVTGQWMRIVPTSWEVFPNALSAVLQYVSLDWPTENGWVNYNSIQQLAYFTTVFIAAPLALITGVRMSALWPKNATMLNKLYPVEWARAVHFPVMLYFVAFIVVHVFLVFATGALRNLNHMYAAQGSVDPTAYAGNWLGLVIFLGSLAVMVGSWFAMRPLVIAPIAKIFGNVSGR